MGRYGLINSAGLKQLIKGSKMDMNELLRMPMFGGTGPRRELVIDAIEAEIFKPERPLLRRWEEIINEAWTYIEKQSEEYRLQYGPGGDGGRIGWSSPRIPPAPIPAYCMKCAQTRAIWLGNHYACESCSGDLCRFDEVPAIAVAEQALQQIRNYGLPLSLRANSMQRLLQVSEGHV